MPRFVDKGEILRLINEDKMKHKLDNAKMNNQVSEIVHPASRKSKPFGGFKFPSRDIPLNKPQPKQQPPPPKKYSQKYKEWSDDIKEFGLAKFVPNSKNNKFLEEVRQSEDINQILNNSILLAIAPYIEWNDYSALAVLIGAKYLRYQYNGNGIRRDKVQEQPQNNNGQQPSA